MNGKRQTKAPVKLSFWRPTAAVIRILAILAMMTTPAAFAQVTYWVSDLGTLGGSSSWPTCINTSGQIVGYSDTSNAVSHAFLYSGGTMTDLGTLGGSDSYACGINNNRQIVGYSSQTTCGGPYCGGYFYHAFLYTILNTGGTLVHPRSSCLRVGVAPSWDEPKLAISCIRGTGRLRLCADVV